MCFLIEEHSTIYSLAKGLNMRLIKLLHLAANLQEVQKPREHTEWSHEYEVILLGTLQVKCLEFLSNYKE